jgi:2-hydroxychromene-2-carboxylate isomerase
MTERVEFFFDPMCPWAYQTSVWIREVRTQRDLDLHWRFFSLEEINRAEGKPHPWERPVAYGWTPLRIAAWLRRLDEGLCDAWYGAAGRALHVEARRPYDEPIARELLAGIGAPDTTWDAALEDPSTHDDVRADHDHAVERWGAFGVPVLVIWPHGPDADPKAVFGPVVQPAPTGADAVALWDLTLAYARTPGLYEIKTPKTDTDLRQIATAFAPYLEARQWPSIQRPAP